ncbi:MAG: murein transglycosylase domain-containing protein [Desulforegulaceae bacterium]|nr:murein transglycosylase domain-containing protein [Desulforegulaceae bacterium]
MRKTLIISLFFIFLTPVLIPAQTSFDDFKKIQKSEYKGYKDTITEDFESYKKELKESFLDYKKKASQVWGQKNAVMPDKKIWVQYRDNMKERNIVDFESGKAIVEIAAEPDDAKDKKKLLEKVTKAIEKAVTSKPDERSIIEIAKNPGAVEEDPKKDAVLKDQIKNKKGEIVTEKNAGEFAKELVKDKKVKVKNLKGDDGKSRLVVSVDFPLVPDHLKKRVDKYKALVFKESKRRSIESKLVFALMETESAFNPTAKSPVPAFGLMQLVPVSGGRDAYKFVHGKDQAPTDRFLYQPPNNVELGTAYLYILYYRYLAQIKDQESRLWCAIASYNTGVGNLLNTFAGKYSRNKFKNRSEWRNKGFGKINTMNSEEVFNYLKKNLPYEETRNYVVKVRERMPKYSSN